MLLVAFCLTAAGCGGGSESTGVATTAEPSATTASAEAPRLSGTTIEGEKLSLGDFRGRPVLVNVWSAW